MFTKKTADDVQEAPRKTLPEGWYQIAFKKTEPRTTKASQGMLNYEATILAEENNPDSGKGNVFGMVLFDAFEDEAAFEANVAEKTGTEGDELAAEVQKRKRMAMDSASNFALAVFGRSEFTQVPLKDKASGEYILPNGETVSNYAERAALYRQRTAEAYNAACAVAQGETDIARYTCYAKIVTETYMGKEKNAVKVLRESLPAGETLLHP